MAARFFIGASEACFGTGVALYLSFFYPKPEVGFRFAIYLVGSAIASALSGSIAYGLQKAQKSTSVPAWKLICECRISLQYGCCQNDAARGSLADYAPIYHSIVVVEAAPTILLGVIVFFCLPDSIKTARFLTPHERKVAEARLYRSTIDSQQQQDQANEGGSKTIVAFIKSRLDVSNFLSALKDPFSYVSSSLLFIANVSYAR